MFTDNASFSDVACGFQHSHRGGLGFANEDVGSQHDKRNAFSVCTHLLSGSPLTFPSQRLLSVVVCFLKAFAKLLNRVGRMNFVGSTAWF